jgi:hypothetical protein
MPCAAQIFLFDELYTVTSSLNVDARRIQWRLSAGEAFSETLIAKDVENR